MQLLSIRIRNYRSVDQEIEIKTEPLSGKSCFFLFGINETGKSNILKACSFLDHGLRTKYKWEKDCSQDNKNNDQPTLIAFSFSLNPEESTEVSGQNQSILQNDKLASQIKINKFNYLVKV